MVSQDCERLAPESDTGPVPCIRLRRHCTRPVITVIQLLQVARIPPRIVNVDETEPSASCIEKHAKSSIPYFVAASEETVSDERGAFKYSSPTTRTEDIAGCETSAME
ncbi:hypothetical protein EVAR_12201_1 [Eumeta japonica]|uniref:Uncharacterized protein n=1 Tax=Eumeta variegata TaxID=151549 RepID=A0A4C1UH06_EUMVA|nr:hypothetical protein EVAR_12201_1 [Eumeta japonica]